MTHYGTDESGNVTLPSDLLPVPTNKQDWKDAYTGTYSSLVFEKLKRIATLELNFPALAESRNNALILSDVKLQFTTSAKPYNGGPFLPWHLVPPSSMPARTFATPSPKLDNHIAHTSCLGKVIGEYCGSPIVALDDLNIEVSIARDLANRLAVSSGTSIPVEVLSGEEISKNNVIRRVTTLETRGEEYYKQELDEVNTKRVNLVEARLSSEESNLVYWRPDHVVGFGEYALVVKEEAA